MGASAPIIESDRVLHGNNHKKSEAGLEYSNERSLSERFTFSNQPP